MVTKIEESSNVFSCKNELDISISNINNLFKNLVDEILSSEKRKTGYKLIINTNSQLEFNKTWKTKGTYNIYQKIYIVKELLETLDEFNFFYNKMVNGMERFVSNYKKQGVSNEALLFLSLFLKKSIDIGASEEQIKNLDYHLTRLKGEDTSVFFKSKNIETKSNKKDEIEKKQILKSKKRTTKKTSNLKVISTKNKIISKKEESNDSNIDKVISKKEIIDNLSLKGKREKDKKSWYEIGKEKLLKSIALIDLNFSRELVNKLKIKDLVEFYNKGFLKIDDKIEDIIFLRLKKEFYLEGDALILYEELVKKRK